MDLCNLICNVSVKEKYIYICIYSHTHTHSCKFADKNININIVPNLFSTQVLALNHIHLHNIVYVLPFLRPPQKQSFASRSISELYVDDFLSDPPSRPVPVLNIQLAMKKCLSKMRFGHLWHKEERRNLDPCNKFRNAIKWYIIFEIKSYKF